MIDCLFGIDFDMVRFARETLQKFNSYRRFGILDFNEIDVGECGKSIDFACAVLYGIPKIVNELQQQTCITKSTLSLLKAEREENSRLKMLLAKNGIHYKKTNTNTEGENHGKTDR